MSLAQRLALYRQSVQHPEAEVAFLLRVYAHYRRRGDSPQVLPTRLREDFAGTGAVAAAWVARHENHRALAVELHEPTLHWAQEQAQRELGDRAGDLHFVRGDVLRVVPPAVPRVDLVAALNFSTFIYHERQDLRAYFAAARRALRPGGLLVLDAYGGPGAMRLGTQRRQVGPGLERRWEQRSYDPVTARVDCRLHFAVGVRGRKKRLFRDAFAYDWRLWTLPELRETLGEAGFSRAEVWCNAAAVDVRYRPVAHLPAREDWVAYVIGVR